MVAVVSLLDFGLHRYFTAVVAAIKDFDSAVRRQGGYSQHLTLNSSVDAGLTNGRQGQIIRPTYSHKIHNYPKYIIVKFDNWKAEELLGGIPIPLVHETIRNGVH